MRRIMTVGQQKDTYFTSTELEKASLQMILVMAKMKMGSILQECVAVFRQSTIEKGRTLFIKTGPSKKIFSHESVLKYSIS